MERRCKMLRRPGIFPLFLLLTVCGCGGAPAPHAISWGTLPPPEAGAYAWSPAAGLIDPGVVGEVRDCLAAVGLRPGPNPRLLIDLTASTAPRHLALSGMAYDQPQPVVARGRLPGRGGATDTLTLVITDMAARRDVYRTQWTRRSPGRHAGPALPAMLCRGLRLDHPTSS